MVSWTPEVERNLLIEIVKMYQPTKIDWKAISEALGEDYTAIACQKKFTKLKQSSTGGSKASKGSDPQTPEKSKKLETYLSPLSRTFKRSYRVKRELETKEEDDDEQPYGPNFLNTSGGDEDAATPPAAPPRKRAKINPKQEEE